MVLGDLDVGGTARLVPGRPTVTDQVRPGWFTGAIAIVFAGMAANLCVESHLRHLLEEGFEVAVVRDATAAARVATGDGYLAALTNYSFLAHAVWMTEEAVSHIR